MVLVASSLAVADETSARDEAPALFEKAKQWIIDNTPESLGTTIQGVDVKVHRKSVDISDVTYDDNNMTMRVKGEIVYYTRNAAIGEHNIDGNFDVKYSLDTGELQGVKFEVCKNILGNDVCVQIDLTPLKKALDGDVSKLLEYIPNFGVVKREMSSEYDSRKAAMVAKYGAKNVYFASSDFVRWCSPETAGKWVGELVASGGSASGVIAQEARSYARKELLHIQRWLSNLGIATASTVVDELLNGQTPSIPELKVVWQRVEYTSKVVIAGRALPEATVPHFAFVIIMEMPGGPKADFDASPSTKNSDNELRPKWRLGARYVIGASGCRLIYVEPGSAAATGGLSVGDIVTKANNVPVGTADKSDLLLRQIKRQKDQKLSLEVNSNGMLKSIDVTLLPVL